MSLERNDFPALYAAAEAYAGQGDVLTSEAHRASGNITTAKLLNDACASYRKSLDVWKHISNPLRYSGNGYLARNSAEIEQRVAACKAEPASR
jgi:hypothetical protein